MARTPSKALGFRDMGLLEFMRLEGSPLLSTLAAVVCELVARGGGNPSGARGSQPCHSARGFLVRTQGVSGGSRSTLRQPEAGIGGRAITSLFVGAPDRTCSAGVADGSGFVHGPEG
jgi:hypothetical protein